ncbi:MAG: NUDIX domain-containing protein [Acidobacteria bacterium]|nr:NUDIX domain-containing protein [Acidobacteriota bacterium]
MPDPPFRTVSSRIVFKNRWIRLVQDDVEAVDDGHRFEYTYLSVADAVMVVAVTPDRRIPIIRQYRYPSKGYNFELPGGGTGGRDPVEAARDELLEETGYRAGRLEKVGDFVTYCGLADEVCHVVLATELEAGPQRLEKTERIELRLTSYPELQAMIQAGEFRDGMGLAALHAARERLEAALTD